jgi:hypothetical protein
MSINDLQQVPSDAVAVHVVLTKDGRTETLELRRSGPMDFQVFQNDKIAGMFYRGLVASPIEPVQDFNIADAVIEYVTANYEGFEIQRIDAGFVGTAQQAG